MGSTSDNLPPAPDHAASEDFFEQVANTRVFMDAYDARLDAVHAGLSLAEPRADTLRKLLRVHGADTELCAFLEQGARENSRLRGELGSLRRQLKQLQSTLESLGQNCGQTISYIATASRKDWTVRSMEGVIPLDYVPPA